MMKKARAAIIFCVLAVCAPASAGQADVLARFQGAIGVIPVQNGAGSANTDGTLSNVKLNVVRGVSPGAGPWRIADLTAEIETDGEIRVKGRGLLLASTNSIGQTANQRVFATLICEASGPFVEHSSDRAGVALDQDGNFRIDDRLTTVPAECPSPVLLIRNTGGVWFAAGIPKLGDD
jgi:hypothetical protein